MTDTPTNPNNLLLPDLGKIQGTAATEAKSFVAKMNEINELETNSTLWGYAATITDVALAAKLAYDYARYQGAKRALELDALRTAEEAAKNAKYLAIEETLRTKLTEAYQELRAAQEAYVELERIRTTDIETYNERISSVQERVVTARETLKNVVNNPDIPATPSTPELLNLIETLQHTGESVNYTLESCRSFEEKLRSEAAKPEASQELKDLVEELDKNEKLNNKKAEYDKRRTAPDAETQRRIAEYSAEKANIERELSTATDDATRARLNKQLETVEGKFRRLYDYRYSSRVYQDVMSDIINRMNASAAHTQTMEAIRILQISETGLTDAKINLETIRTSSIRAKAEEMRRAQTAEERMRNVQTELETRIRELEAEAARNPHNAELRERAAKAREGINKAKNIWSKGNIAANGLMFVAALACTYKAIEGQVFDAQQEKMLTDLMESVNKDVATQRTNTNFSEAQQKYLIQWGYENATNPEEKELFKKIRDTYNSNYGAYLAAEGKLLENDANLDAYTGELGEGLTKTIADQKKETILHNANMAFFQQLATARSARSPEDDFSLEPQGNAGNTPSQGQQPNTPTTQAQPRASAAGNDGSQPTDATNPNATTAQPMPTQTTTPDGKWIFYKTKSIQRGVIAQSGTIVERAKELAAQEYTTTEIVGANAMAWAVTCAKIGWDKIKYNKAREYFRETLKNGYGHISQQIRNSPQYTSFKPILDEMDRLNTEIANLKEIESRTGLDSTQRTQLENLEAELRTKSQSFVEQINRTELKIADSNILEGAKKLQLATESAAIRTAEQEFMTRLAADTTPATEAARAELREIEGQPEGEARSRALKELAEKVNRQHECGLNKETMRQYQEVLDYDGATETARRLKSTTAAKYADVLHTSRAAVEARHAELESELLKRRPGARGPIRAKLQSAQDWLRKSSKVNMALFAASAFFTLYSIDGEEFPEQKQKAIEDLLKAMQGQLPIQAEKLKDPKLNSYEERLALINWGLARTQNTEEKEFLIKLRDTYNCDYGKYLKEEKLILQTDMTGLQVTPAWLEAAGEVVMNNANVQLFTHMQEVRNAAEREQSNANQNDDNTSTSNAVPNTPTSGNTPTDPTLPNGAGTAGSDSADSDTDGSDSSTPAGNTPTDAATSHDAETSDNDNGTTDGTDGGTEGDSDSDSDGSDTDGEENNPSSTVRVTPPETRIQPEPATVSPETQGPEQPRETTRPPVAPRPTTVTMTDPPYPSHPVSPVVVSQPPVHYSGPTSSSPRSTNEPTEQERAAIAAIQNEAAKEEEGNWFTRNWSTILMALAIIASLGIAYFFIRKYKKDSDKAKDETNVLKGQISELQDKITNAGKDNSQNNNSNSTDNKNDNATGKSTLAQNAVAVKNMEIQTGATTTINNSKSIG